MVNTKVSDKKKQGMFMDKFSFLGEEERRKIKNYYEEKYNEKIKNLSPNNVIENLRNHVMDLKKQNTDLIKTTDSQNDKILNLETKLIDLRENLKESENNKPKKDSEETLKFIKKLYEKKINDLKNSIIDLKNRTIDNTKKDCEETLKSTKKVYEHKIKKLKSELEMYKNPKTDGEGWKGKSGIKVIPLGNTEFNIITHRKNKNTLQVQKTSTIISKTNINILLTIVRDLTDNGEVETRYREVAKKLIRFYKLRIGIDAFNGGHNRKTYFEIYQYPIKILEYFKIVSYSGRGVINLINNRRKKI